MFIIHQKVNQVEGKKKGNNQSEINLVLLMDSNETRWMINPIDLFKNEKETTFSKYEDINLNEFDIFLSSNSADGAHDDDKENKKVYEDYNFPIDNQDILMTPIDIETNNNLYTYNNNSSNDNDKENESNNILINNKNDLGQENMSPAELMNPLIWDELLLDYVDSDPLPCVPIQDTANDSNNSNQATVILDNLNKMDQQLLEQQEQLNIEIQKQKKMNKLLEEKLKQTQLQQQQLRKILKEQQALSSVRFVLGDITQSSRLNNTPKKKIKEFNVSKSTNNSPIKKIQNTKLSFVNSLHSTSKNNNKSNNSNGNGINNSSPKRRQYRFKNNVSDNDSTKQKFQRIKDKNLKINFTTTLTPKDQDNFLTDSALSSPVRVSPNRSYIESPTREYLDMGSPVLGNDLRQNLDINTNLISLRPLADNVLNRSLTNNNFKESTLLDDLPTTFQDTPIRTKDYISPISILMPPSEDHHDTRSPSKSTIIKNSIPFVYSSQKELKKIPAISKSNKLNESFIHVNETPSSTPELRDSSKKLLSDLNGQLEQSEHQVKSVSPSKGPRKFTKLSRDELDRYVKELPDRLFECLYPNCGKFFKRRYNIRTHIQTHLEDRPYGCDFPGCNKAFVRNHDLIRHKKTHLKKKFVCACGKIYYREEQLFSHQNKMICIGGKQYYNVLTEQPSRSSNLLCKDVTTRSDSLASSNLPSSSESFNREDSNKENSYGTRLVFKMKCHSIDFPVNKDIDSI